MYAVWFMGFMLVFATVTWDAHKRDTPITDAGLAVVTLMSLGSWPALLVVCLSLWARDAGHLEDDEH